MIKDAVKQILDKGITEETLYDFALATHICLRESSGTVKDNKEKLLKLFKNAFDEFEKEEEEAMGKALESVLRKAQRTLNNAFKSSRGKK